MYASLLLGTLFVLTQFGTSLFFCVSSHTHIHLQDSVPEKQEEMAGYSLKCDHSCKGHAELNNVSYAVVPENEDDGHIGSASDLPYFFQYRHLVISREKSPDINSCFQNVPPLLRSMVMRC